MLLYLGPDIEQRSWKLITPGAVTAMILWLVASGGFAIYAARFGSYNKAWGTLSAVVVMLVWLWLTSAALLFGAEVNAQTRKLVAEEASAEGPKVPQQRVQRHSGTSPSHAPEIGCRRGHRRQRSRRRHFARSAREPPAHSRNRPAPSPKGGTAYVGVAKRNGGIRDTPSQFRARRLITTVLQRRVTLQGVFGRRRIHAFEKVRMG